MKIKLVEIFPSFQGEGVDTGKKMVILRFKYCNRIYENNACKFCDTIQKLNTLEEKEYSIKDIQKVIDNFGLGTGILLTGGEPTANISNSNHDIYNFSSSLFILKNLRYEIANVESNGFKLLELVEKSPTDKNINFIYSPKVFNLNELIETRRKINFMINIESIKFKIVYQKSDLIYNILDYLSEHNLHSRVFLMPEGKTRDELINNSEETLKAVNKYKFNFSSRIHIIHNFT